MSIRTNIIEYLDSKECSLEDSENVALNTLDIVESEGLDLTDFYEESPMLKRTQKIIESSIKHEASNDCLAISVILLLEDIGLGISGNGWIDDDPLVEKIMDEVYSCSDGKIKTQEYQKVYDIMN